MKLLSVLALALPAAVLAAPGAVVNDDPQDLCQMCEQVVVQLKDEGTLAQVEETLDKACTIVPHFLFDQCTAFVGQIKEQIDELAKADPKDACQQVGLCPPEPEPTSTPAVKTTEASTPTNGFACEACKWSWEAIEKSGPTADQLKDQLETMCTMVPPDLKDQCEQAVTQIVDQYKEGLKQTPQQACEQLQLCDAEPTPTTSTTANVAAPTSASHAIIDYIKSAGSRLQLQRLNEAKN